MLTHVLSITLFSNLIFEYDIKFPVTNLEKLYFLFPLNTDQNFLLWRNIFYSSINALCVFPVKSEIIVPIYKYKFFLISYSTGKKYCVKKLCVLRQCVGQNIGNIIHQIMYVGKFCIFD
jgi:hypothetical protein